MKNIFNNNDYNKSIRIMQTIGQPGKHIPNERARGRAVLGFLIAV